MKELVNNWNEKHTDYQLVHGTYSYVVEGQSRNMHMLTIFNKDNADDLYWWYVTFSIDTTAV